MVLVLGVSAGACGARAVLTHSDQPHLDPIDRCQVPRRAGAGIEEAVFEAIRRMRVAAARRDELITRIAVTCRCSLHADSIRSAAGGHELTVVDEPLAQLRYLRFTGALPDTGTVVLYDLGSSGLTITHIDCRTDAVLASRRSTVLGGDGYDALLRWQLARGGVLTDKPTIRKHREALSSERVVTAMDPGTDERAVVTRSDLAELCAAGIHHSASFVRQLTEETGVRPDAMVLLGGCTRNPTIRAELERLVGMPIVYDPEPEYVSARGAVLLAAERRAAEIKMPRLRHRGLSASLAGGGPVGRRKLVAALAVTAGLGATIAGLLTVNGESGRPPPGGGPPPAQRRTPRRTPGAPRAMR
ncbi:Hsp70 family protein [Nocardia cyriacigeorgica]|uniref:Hsp70 family protein n=1 Tax=Nocardia cyriacigeorgica TaxID=135487 RepID=UPI0024575F9D|nr:Hsp70 family protein [Nocardia cyriacigeorgica]